MEREELRSKIDEALGSTQLSLSERTVNEELDDALSDVTDDAQVDEKFCTRIANRLKRMSGNLHADVGAESKKYREQFEKDWKEKHPDVKPPVAEQEKSELEKKVEALMARMEKADEDRKAREADAKKSSSLKQVKDELNSLFKKAEVEPNNYILRQTMRDVEIPDGDVDIDAIVKKTEKAYYKNLKEAGFETDGKPKGGGLLLADKKMSDDLWSRKKAKEGWGSKE